MTDLPQIPLFKKFFERLLKLGSKTDLHRFWRERAARGAILARVRQPRLASLGGNLAPTAVTFLNKAAGFRKSLFVCGEFQ